MAIYSGRVTQSEKTPVADGYPQPHAVDLIVRLEHPTVAGLDQLVATIRDAHAQAQGRVPGSTVETLHATAPRTAESTAETAPDQRLGRIDRVIVNGISALAFTATVSLALAIVGYAGSQLFRLIGAMV